MNNLLCLQITDVRWLPYSSVWCKLCSAVGKRETPAAVEQLRRSSQSKKELEHGCETCRWRLEHEINCKDLNIGLSSPFHHGKERKKQACSLSAVQCWMTGGLCWNETSLTESISAGRAIVWQLEKQQRTFALIQQTDTTSVKKADGKTHPYRPKAV